MVIKLERANSETGLPTGQFLWVRNPDLVGYVVASEIHEGVSIVAFMNEKSFYIRGAAESVAALLDAPLGASADDAPEEAA